MEQNSVFSAESKHLQVTLAAEQYLNVIREADSITDLYVKKTNTTIIDYWQRLPVYTIACCPFCSATYRERLDTHSLKYWQIDSEAQSYIFSKIGQSVGCRHFVAVQAFVNLNGHFYEEFNRLEMPLFVNDNGDIPFVFPKLLPNALPSIAVIHSLPICDLENGQFVPRYSLYMITYYAENPQAVKDYRWKEQPVRDPDAYILLLESPHYMRRHPETADLKQWVNRGKLQWLDPYSPDLPLKAGPAEAFPYAGITGYGQRFVYRPKPVVDLTPSWKFWHKRPKLLEGGRIEVA